MTHPAGLTNSHSKGTRAVERRKCPAMAPPERKTDSFKGCTQFRHRIVTATLAGKPIRISDIRANTVRHAACGVARESVCVVVRGRRNAGALVRG